MTKFLLLIAAVSFIANTASAVIDPSYDHCMLKCMQLGVEVDCNADCRMLLMYSQ